MNFNKSMVVDEFHKIKAKIHNFKVRSASDLRSKARKDPSRNQRIIRVAEKEVVGGKLQKPIFGKVGRHIRNLQSAIAESILPKEN